MKLSRSIIVLKLIQFIVVVAGLATLSFAEQPSRVYLGRYIITPPRQTAAMSISGALLGTNGNLALAGVHFSRQLGRSSLLKRGYFESAAQSMGDDADDQIVPFDPQDRTCDDLMRQGLASSCTPDWEMRAYDTTPNDPQLSQLWGMIGTYGADARRAWDVSTGSSNVVVAIIDTGVDYNHPELAANMWTNPSDPAGGGDQDNSGYVDDIHGVNFVKANGNPMDDNNHGTHVAGTIGAVGNNGVGVVGMNWNVKIMALKFLDHNGSGSLSSAVQAINYMVMMKGRGVNIRVANNSWGGGGYSQALYDAIKAANDAGILFIAAAGNESNDNDSSPSYPASYNLPNLVSVAAIDSGGNLASFSNFGANGVDIAAPGVDILSTTPGNHYATYSGTSMATPHVTGAVALLAAAEPSLGADALKARVLESGVPLATLLGLVRTGRTLSAGRMLYNETEPLPPAPVSPGACHYAIETTAYAPDYSADAQPLVQQADELNFVKIDMPFIFPFKKMDVTSISISPNGVVYMNSPSTSLDYVNGATAPVKSIAALQTDLYAADGSSYGVRVATSTDKVVIYWKVKSYLAANKGDVEVRLELFSDGRIHDSVDFSSNTLADVIGHSSTIGLNGVVNQGSDTYAYNNPSRVRTHLGVMFTPACDGSDAGDTAQVKRVQVAAPSKGIIKAGSKFNVRIDGLGSGPVSVGAVINGKACDGGVSAVMNDGRVNGIRRGLLPKNARIQSFAITADGVSGKSKLYSKVHAKSVKLSTKDFSKACGAVLKSLH